MTCKKCKYEFCWVCMGEWSAHGTSWYSCNRCVASLVRPPDRAATRRRPATARPRRVRAAPRSNATSSCVRLSERPLIVQYYNRYANHEQSAKLEKELFIKIEKKMEEMQNSSQLSWIEVRCPLRRAP